MHPPRIALLHATALAIAPVQAAFQRHWPAAHCSPDCAVLSLMRRMPNA